MQRRTFLRGVGAGGAGLSLGGCLGAPSSGPVTLTVATYGPFVDAPSTSPGPWIKEQFESEFDDVELQWFTPENELNYFIQRRNAGVTIDTDVYVGLNVDDLIRIDETLTGEGLLAGSSRDDLSNADAVKSELEFDPQRRAVPFDTGYISLVYDGRTIDDPETFEALTTDEYEDALIAQNAQTSDPGRAFLLWTIRNYGEDYLDYWRRLVDNGLRITGSWSDAYGAWSEGERPMVVSYSTDQVPGKTSKNTRCRSSTTRGTPTPRGWRSSRAPTSPTWPASSSTGCSRRGSSPR